nr:rod-binding protein [Oceaniglobus indicus]
MLSPPITQSAHIRPSDHDGALHKAAQQMETAFLSEMLKAAGLGESRQVLGGGAGEEQFGSFLRHAQAEHMVMAGGIGLSEHLFEALKARDNAL